MTLDDLTITQFFVLTFISLGICYVVAAAIAVVKDNRSADEGNQQSFLERAAPHDQRPMLQPTVLQRIELATHGAAPPAREKLLPLKARNRKQFGSSPSRRNTRFASTVDSVKNSPSVVRLTRRSTSTHPKQSSPSPMS